MVVSSSTIGRAVARVEKRRRAWSCMMGDWEDEVVGFELPFFLMFAGCESQIRIEGRSLLRAWGRSSSSYRHEI
jgi:hypothetical protein